jgi:hypothetical protein
LGGRVYSLICDQVFVKYGFKLIAPLLGQKGNGLMQHAVKNSIQNNQPFFL